MTHILLLNGPNLNLLGTREPEIYGHTTLPELEAQWRAHAMERKLALTCRQSNDEATLIDWIHTAGNATARADTKDHASYDGLIVNAGAYTHTSVALHDALRALTLPIIEVHISNIYARESFRHRSFISPLARGVLCGFGTEGYRMAIDAMAQWLHED